VVQVIWSDEASRSLEEIHSYIAAERPDAAEATVRGIIRKADLLQSFPELGPPLQGYERRAIRALVYGHYRLIYRLISPDVVELIGIFHGAMDLDRRLRQRTDR